MKSINRIILLVFLLTGICTSANAKIMKFDFDLEVTTASANPFSLNTGSTMDVFISLDNNYDPNVPTNPDYTTHSPDDYANPNDFALELTVDGTTYTEIDDIGYSAWPYVTVNKPSWNFHRAEMFTTGLPNNFYIHIDEFDGFIMQSVVNGEITKDWLVRGKIVGSLEPIPEPATLALLGMGLLGLVGITRKKLLK